MKTAAILLLVLVVGIANAQVEYCAKSTFSYLNSMNVSANSVANKPLTIKASDGILANVQFIVLDASIDSYIQVTVIGQGTTFTTASSLGSVIDSSNGLTITLNHQPGKVSASSTIQSSLTILLCGLLFSCFFGKRSIAFFLILSCALYMTHAGDPCVDGQVGATVIIALPNQFAFSIYSFSLNGGNLTCESDPGLFVPVCNSIYYLPVIPGSVGPYGPQGYSVQWITGGIWAVWDGYGVYNSMFVVTDAGVIVVDAPASLGTGYITAVQSITSQPIKYLAYSHLHTDHIGAADSNFGNITGLQVVGHQNVYNAIALSNSPFGVGRILPTITFQDNYTLTLGNETLILSYLGVGHSLGDTVLYSPNHKVIQVVDLFSSSYAPFRNLFETIYVQGFIKSHALILDYDFDTLVGGHINLVQRSDVLRSQTLVMAIRQAAINALSTVTPPNTGVDKNGVSNSWLTYNVYLTRCAEVCADNFRSSNAQFFTQYSALDVFLYSFCDNMVRSMRIE